MTTKPAALDAPPRYDPVFVTEKDLEDLSLFTGMSHDECLHRLRSYSPAELAEAWRTANPRTPEALVEFYRSTDLYLWELLQWHASTARRPYWEALDWVAEHCPADRGWRRVYDFGCGIGTDALFLAANGYEVTLVDVECAASRFARFRLGRRGLSATFVESRSPLPDPDAVYDIVVCFDVLEHLPDPLEAARRLVCALRPRGVLVQQATFEDDGVHPCHVASGVARFHGLRWHASLAGLGLRNATGKVYRKGSMLERGLQLLRYGLWRLTGLWLVSLRSQL